LQEADPNFRPVFAGIHYEVGRALLDLKETAQAIEHFRTARNTDPHGCCGSLAIKRLEELSQPA
jgi:hypothetical protein